MSDMQEEFNDHVADRSPKTPVNSLVMDNRQIKSELLRIASVLVQCHYIPSDLVDDYPQKTYSAGRVAQMMEKAHDKSKSLAIQVRNLAESIKL